jgi:hypothetical protein
MKTKLKRGQLVMRIDEGNNLYYVMEADHPKMLVYCIDSPIDILRGKTLEVNQIDFIKV